MKRAATRAVAWSGAEAACSGALSIASALFVARIVGPAELGIGAAAVSVNVLLWVGVNGLFGDALVQRRSVDEADITSALWASVVFGCGAALVQVAAGVLLAHVLDDARLTLMGLALALPLPLVGAAGVAQGRLTRARGYAQLAGRTIVGQGLGTTTGVLAALAGTGAWATVGQQVVTVTIGALALLAGARRRPTLAAWRWRPVRELLAVGVPLTASSLAHHARYRLFALLIGGMMGPAALGEVHVAFRLVDTVRELSFTALWRLMLPVLSERQADRSALLAGVDRLLGLSSMAMLPLCGAMAVALRPLVALLLGARWEAAGAAAEPLIALMALLVLGFPSGVALVAIGRARYTLYANLAGIATMVAGLFLAGPRGPLGAVLVWCLSHALVMPYAMWTNARALGVGLLRPLRAGLPMLAGTSVAVSVVLLLTPASPSSLNPAVLIAVRLSLVLLMLMIGAGVLLSRGRKKASFVAVGD